MALHPDSESTIYDLKGTFEKLTHPINQVIRANGWNSDKVDGPKALALSLFKTGIYFAALGGALSDEGTSLLADINLILLPSSFDMSQWTKSQHQQMFWNLYRSEPEFYRKPEIPASVIFLMTYDPVYGTDYTDQARAMHFRYANAVVKANGSLTQTEEDALREFKELLFGIAPNEGPIQKSSKPTLGTFQPTLFTRQLKSKNTEPQNTELTGNPTQDFPRLMPNQVISTKIEASDIQSASSSLQASMLTDSSELLDELDALIGLEGVKSDVKQLVNFLKIQQLRKSRGLGIRPISRHLVFSGNPGTGKTTVARLLAQIYKSLGILSKGHTVETDRSDLVAGYIGQTALKVKDVIDGALGGILFIDEAYTLSTGNSNDYGQEAIDILLKAMEDNRDDFIVIVAGYTNKMKGFLSSNPGLRSRFNKYLNFEDYTPVQLVDIFGLYCKEADYYITQPAKANLLSMFSALHETRDETFGNARLARNLFELTLSNQANRIVTVTDLTEESLSAVTEADLPIMSDLQSIR